MSFAQYVTRMRLEEEDKAGMACKQNCIGKNQSPEQMLTTKPKKVLAIHTTCSALSFFVPLLK